MFLGSFHISCCEIFTKKVWFVILMRNKSVFIGAIIIISCRLRLTQSLKQLLISGINEIVWKRQSHENERSIFFKCIFHSSFLYFFPFHCSKVKKVWLISRLFEISLNVQKKQTQLSVVAQNLLIRII